ncbi:coiled-coil domain-containing protein 97 [Phlebotomus argentipes]|uniref:coiled-coil domain-containing protein 97 n=1 Tax=Phlebotomus argentipes TaxID=94469 RepID=UPI0028929E47|nr:coiled-coil domain-containing protein 97 [Phlebotomus argentipes]
MLPTILDEGAVVTEEDELRRKIIENICLNDQVFFKSQQIDDPELTRDEKEEIVKSLWNKKDSLFLDRFGKFIDQENLVYFEEKGLTGDEEYIVRQQLERLRKWHKNRGVEVRNRRYAAMQKMIAENSSYFTETEMMNREPLLYDQLVGQFLTEQEKRSRDNRDSSSLLNVLMNGIEDDEYSERLKQEKNDQEEDSSSSSDASNRSDCNPRGRLWGEFAEDQPSSSTSRQSQRKAMTSSERDLLRQEFMGIMYTNFLQGTDKDFDYSAVDNNPDYDNDAICSRDEEEKYFDAEDSSESGNAGYHNVQEASSEDELDVFMAHLSHQTPLQKQL